MEEAFGKAKKTADGTLERQAPPLGTLASGQTVIDRKNSHLHDDPGMMELLGRAFQHIRLNGENFVRAEVDFNAPIGVTSCVETSPTDTIRFAQRDRRPGVTRFVMNRTKEPTQLLTVVLLKNPQETGTYILITAFPGAPAPSEPWDPNSPEESAAFWSTHALVWDGRGIIQGTERENPGAYWQRMPARANAFPQQTVHELKISIPEARQ